MRRECVTSNVENVKERGFRLLARHDRGGPPADTLPASCESPARMRFRSTGSDPVGAAPVVRPMSAALNGSGRRKTASRSADEQHPLDSSSTPRSGAPSQGAAERRQEHHALPFCVRGEELRNVVVEEGESGGAETKCVGGEVEAAADDSPLELSGPIAAITEPGEDRLEIREAVDVRPGCGRELLEEAESARDRTKLAFLEELERALRAPEVIGTGRQTLHRVCDHVEVEQARLRVLREVRWNRGGRDGERSGKLLEGERARDVETTRRAPAEDDALERLGRPVRLRERTKGKELAPGIWFRTRKDHAAPACDLLPVLEARRAMDLADCRVVGLSRRRRLGLEVQHGSVRRGRWRLGRSPERNEGKGPFPSRVQSEKVLDVPIHEA